MVGGFCWAGLHVAACNFALASSELVGWTRSCIMYKISSLACVFDLFFTCNFVRVIDPHEPNRPK